LRPDVKRFQKVRLPDSVRAGHQDYPRDEG
jgi:hypothetical protein